MRAGSVAASASRPDADHQAAHGDEGVAAPVGEPGKPREDRAAGAAIHDIGRRRRLPRVREPVAARGLGDDQARSVGAYPRIEGVARPQHHERLVGLEIPGEHTRGGTVFAVVQATIALGGVQEPPVPLGLGPVRAVGESRDRRTAGVWPPGDVAALHKGSEIKARILVMQSVVVPPRYEQPDAEALAAIAAPSQHRFAGVPGDQDLLPDRSPAARIKGPGWPRDAGEVGDPPRAVGTGRTLVLLGRQRNPLVPTLQPGFDAIDQDHAVRRRLPRGEQERMIAPGPGDPHNSGREAAETVSLQPLRSGVGHRHVSFPGSLGLDEQRGTGT